MRSSYGQLVWLNDYAFYMALKFHFDNQEWLAWPEDIRFRKKEAVESYREELKDEIDFWKFLQYKFYQQWGKLRAYANEQGISIIGDIPIYVALDSADVWTHPELFLLDEENLTPIKVAGVPPDAFSETGQLWGNPLYRWDVQEKTDFAWWRSSWKASARLYGRGPYRPLYRCNPVLRDSGGVRGRKDRRVVKGTWKEAHRCHQHGHR